MNEGEVEVIALETGLYKGCSKYKDDKFVISSFQQLGSWMKCVNPELEKKHIENMLKRGVVFREGKKFEG